MQAIPRNTGATSFAALTPFARYPKERWDPDVYYDPDRNAPDKTYSKMGAFILGFEKDPLKFRIPPISAPFIDRIQFLALESAHQALGDAGYLERSFPRERTGVFVGCSGGGGELRLAYNLRTHWARFAGALEQVHEFSALPEHLKTAIELTTGRGKAIATYGNHNGSMAAVSAPADRVADFLAREKGFVTVANHNSPEQVVIAGDVRAVESATARLEEHGIACWRLPVSAAFHTRLLAPCAEPFRRLLNECAVHPPRIPVQCNLTGQAYDVNDDFAPNLRDTLVNHLSEPVRFAQNIQSLYEAGARLFVEIGPGSTLCSFVNAILADKSHQAIPSNLQRRPATLQLLHTLAFCATRGLPIDFRGAKPERTRPGLGSVWCSSATHRRRISVQELSKEHRQGLPNLIEEALARHDNGAVDLYLKHRGDFLKSMVQVDFQYYTGNAPVRLLSEVPTGPQGEEALKSRVVQLVARKTGYPPDAIDIDLDVEAELGLDSIKQVEVIRELSRDLKIDFGQDPRSQRYKISTLRELISLANGLLSETPRPEPAEPSLPKSATQAQMTEASFDCHRWVCTKVEVPLQGRTDHEALKGKHVLLLTGEGGPGGLLRKGLEERGASVTTLVPHAAIDQISPDFDIVLDLWAFGEDDQPDLAECASWWDRIAQRSALFLAVARKIRGSIGADSARRMHWVEVTSLGGQLAAGTMDQVPSAAGIGLGLSRCLLAETYGAIDGLYLDFDPPESDAATADRIIAELMVSHRHLEIGYEGGKRFEIRWEIAEHDAEERKFRLDSESVVLAIGGARGITAAICRELADHARPRLVVVGRSFVNMEANADIDESLTFEAAREQQLSHSRSQGEAVVPSQVDRAVWKNVWANERMRNMRLLREITASTTYLQCDITKPQEID